MEMDDAEMAERVERWRRMAELVQHLPQHRARINPAHLPELVCYIVAIRDEYDKAARMTLHGLKGVQRNRRKGQIDWARTMVRAIDAIIERFGQTVDLRLVDQAREGIASASRDGKGE